MNNDEFAHIHGYGADPFGNARGFADGSGAVDMGAGVHALPQEYDTVRLPDDLGGAWVCVVKSQMMRLPDGRIGRYLHLTHPEIDCIEMRDGSGALWVRKPTHTGGEEE
tara:strand:- start:1016 stop:1342 length:327 start_codon:yes stop_codon:yes gene_type:complete